VPTAPGPAGCRHRRQHIDEAGEEVSTMQVMKTVLSGAQSTHAPRIDAKSTYKIDARPTFRIDAISKKAQ